MRPFKSSRWESRILRSPITPLFRPYVVPATVVILVGLFAIQKYGTHRVGGLFGPVMVISFVTIAALGVAWITQAPAVLARSTRGTIRATAFFRLPPELVVGTGSPGEDVVGGSP